MVGGEARARMVLDDVGPQWYTDTATVFVQCNEGDEVSVEVAYTLNGRPSEARILFSKFQLFLFIIRYFEAIMINLSSLFFYFTLAHSHVLIFHQ